MPLYEKQLSFASQFSRHWIYSTGSCLSLLIHSQVLWEYPWVLQRRSLRANFLLKEPIFSKTFTCGIVCIYILFSACGLLLEVSTWEVGLMDGPCPVPHIALKAQVFRQNTQSNPGCLLLWSFYFQLWGRSWVSVRSRCWDCGRACQGTLSRALAVGRLVLGCGCCAFFPGSAWRTENHGRLLSRSGHSTPVHLSSPPSMGVQGGGIWRSPQLWCIIGKVSGRLAKPLWEVLDRRLSASGCYCSKPQHSRWQNSSDQNEWFCMTITTSELHKLHSLVHCGVFDKPCNYI